MTRACAAYLGRARWPNGFVCPHCGRIAEPFRIVTRPGVWKPCVPPPSRPPGRHGHGTASYAAQRLVLGRLPRRQPDAGHVGGAVAAQLGLTRYEPPSASSTNCAGHRCDRTRTVSVVGRKSMWRSMRRRSVEGRAAKAGASTTERRRRRCRGRHRKPGTAQDKRKDGRYAGRVRLAIAADRSADSLCGFVESPSCRAR